MMDGDVEVKSRSCCGMESSVSLGFTLGCMCSPTNDIDVYKRRVEMVGCGILHSATTPEESQVVDSPWTIVMDRSGEREGVGFGDEK